VSVTTVVVARDGRVWLPTTLAALATQTAPPQRIIGVDAGSSDDSAQILRAALGADQVISLATGERPTGFGEAVGAALAQGESGLDDAAEWIWLLHDDSAPDPQALQRLMEAAQERPRAGILGPKCLGWHDRRLLIEVGFSITGSGRRFTDLDPAEHDQGQHDGRDVVHAVGTAGMLIRRDVFDTLGGFDPALPLYRDDLDLCWRAWRAGHEVHVVPDAVIYHREASYHGRRTGSTRSGQGHRLDRRSAVHVLLAQTPLWRLPFTAVRLGLGSLVVALIALLGKDARRASDELLAWGAVLAHPGRLLAARRRIATTSQVSSRAAVGEFRPGIADQGRQVAEQVSGWFSGRRTPREPSVAIAPETGPSDESMDLFDDGSATWLRRFLTRPGFVVFAISLIVTVAATRGLWWGGGSLVGGALLPAPAGASDLWAYYAQTWHDVGPGSTVAAPPWLALLAAWATILLGSAGAAVGSLLLLAVPAAALSAWWSLRGVIVANPVRIWAALAYAIVPAMTGAIATGRIGTTAALILLPPTARAIVRSLATAHHALSGVSSARGRTVWWAALLLTALTAVAPVLWPVTTVLILITVVAVVVATRGATVVLRAAIIVVTPMVLLLPWSLVLIGQPDRLLLEPGLAVSASADLGAVSLLAVNPGGPGTPAIWVGAGIAIAGVVALLRIDRRRAIVIALLVAGVGLIAAVIAVHLRVANPSAATSIVPWPGTLTGLTAAGFITAAALGADGLRQRMSGQAFTWRQPISGLAALAAVATVVIAAVAWVPGAGDPLRRGSDAVLPPFVAAEAQGPQAPRTLVVRPKNSGSAASVVYSLVNGDGPTLGDPDVMPPPRAWEPLDRLVSTLVSGRGGAEVSGLADYAVRYVLAEVEPGDPLVRNLDAVPGLRRVAGDTGAALWRVAGATSRVRAIPAEETAAGAGVVSLPVTDLSAAQPLVNSPVPGPGEIRLAQDANAPWRAVLADGRVLAASPLPTGVDDVGLARFILPSSVGPGERVVISIDTSTRTVWLWVQAGLVLLVIVLALPARRRAGHLADDAIDEDVRDES
jgi:GT2 family glycosyltransferase